MAIQWGSITGNIEDQSDLSSSLSSIIQLLQTQASTTAMGITKPDQSTISVDDNGVASVVTTSCSEQKDKVVLVANGVIDLSQGNFFVVECNEDCNLSIVNASSSKYTNFYLTLILNGNINIGWPSGVLWQDGEAPILSINGIDLLNFTTNDRTNWSGRAIIKDAGTRRKSKIYDTEGLGHVISTINDDGTYQFVWDGIDPLPYINEDVLSFDMLETVTNDAFIPNAISPNSYNFEDYTFNSVSFPELTEVSGENSMYEMFAGASDLLEAGTISQIDFPKLTTVSGLHSMREMFDACDIGTVNFSALESVSNKGMEHMFRGCTIEEVNFDNLETVSGAGLNKIFEGCTLGAINMPKLTNVEYDGTGAWDGGWFQNLQEGSITELEFPSLEYVGGYGMAQLCYKSEYITTVKFPALVDVGGRESFYAAFRDCSSLTTVEFPALHTINANRGFPYAFANTPLTSIEFPALRTIGLYGLADVFTGGSGESPPPIEEASFPSLVVVGGHGLSSAFRNCTHLETISFPVLENALYQSFQTAFYGCTSLTQADFPVLINADNAAFQGAFGGCTSLTQVDFSSLEGARGEEVFKGAFHGCTSLQRLDFPSLTVASNRIFLFAFDDCTNLKEIHFRADKQSDTTFVQYVTFGIPRTVTIYWDL